MDNKLTVMRGWKDEGDYENESIYRKIGARFYVKLSPEETERLNVVILKLHFGEHLESDGIAAQVVKFLIESEADRISPVRNTYDEV